MPAMISLQGHDHRNAKLLHFFCGVRSQGFWLRGHENWEPCCFAVSGAVWNSGPAFCKSGCHCSSPHATAGYLDRANSGDDSWSPALCSYHSPCPAQEDAWDPSRSLAKSRYFCQAWVLASAPAPAQSAELKSVQGCYSIKHRASRPYLC